MASKNMSQAYSPTARSSQQFQSMSDRINALHNWSPTDATGDLTSPQNSALRAALTDAFRVIGGEDNALAQGALGKTASVGFSLSGNALAIYAALA